MDDKKREFLSRHYGKTKMLKAERIVELCDQYCEQYLGRPLTELQKETMFLWYLRNY